MENFFSGLLMRIHLEILCIFTFTIQDFLYTCSHDLCIFQIFGNPRCSACMNLVEELPCRVKTPGQHFNTIGHYSETLQEWLGAHSIIKCLNFTHCLFFFLHSESPWSNTKILRQSLKQEVFFFGPCLMCVQTPVDK